jgi:hypothetical protein
MQSTQSEQPKLVAPGPDPPLYFKLSVMHIRMIEIMITTPWVVSEKLFTWSPTVIAANYKMFKYAW